MVLLCGQILKTLGYSKRRITVVIHTFSTFGAVIEPLAIEIMV